MNRYLSRRGLIGATAGAGAAGVLMTLKLDPFAPAAAHADAPGAVAAQTSGLGFVPVSLDTEDRVLVPGGYTSRVLIRWGDPLTVDGQGFTFGALTPEQQMQSFGYNCDYIGFMPLTPGWGLLIVNHEYTNPEIMFPGYDADNPTKEQVDVELAAHGLSVVVIEEHPTFGWRYRLSGWANRRITAFTKTMLTGPAAGHPLLRTTADPAGYTVEGTLNNCSAGITPWGTVLTCEENFNQYFANNNSVADAGIKAAHTRYGLTATASSRKWERFYDRFDLAKEPNEAFRFGWVVEVDPHDPSWMPRKRTALGRFKHEGTSTVVTADGRVAVYSGDDERFDYMYKFVSAATYNPSDRLANRDGGLLDEGTLYVAKLNDDGSGEWLPLIHGQLGLTAANGFASQGDILIKTRQAGDIVGATKMDRPEDFEVNPVNGRVYCALTNNTQRGTSGRPGTDGPNPRANNAHGQVIELTPAGGDHGSTHFTWAILLLCGRPGIDAGTYYGGFDQSQVSPLSSPDNVTFDNRGNLWISTDGQTGTFETNDGVYAVPVDGVERGYARQFFSGVPGGETASLCFDDTNETLFVTIQHPGEGSTLDELTSHFPDGAEPRPSVVLVRKDGGGVIGS